MYATLALRLAMSLFLLTAGPFFAPAAANWTVISLADSGPGTLRTAIETANAVPGADKILFAAGGEIALLTPLPEIMDDLTLVGGGQVTLNGQGLSGGDWQPMLPIAAGVVVSIRGMTITGAPYGAVQNAGSLTLQDCVFMNNESPNSGGAIQSSGWLSVKRTTFSGNRSDEYGGAIYSTGTLRLQSVDFDRNRSYLEAGAVYSNGLLEGENVHFTGNEATEDEGGALQLFGTARLARATFVNNSVNNGGGAISNHGSLELAEVEFRDNSSKWGGAILNWVRASLIVQNGTFTRNIAGHHGGAIDNGGTVYLTNAVLAQNFAYDLGGALNNDGTAYLTNVILENNRGGWGGAIFNQSELGLQNSFVGGNSSSYEGGGLYNGFGLAAILNATFSGNTSPLQGGAIYNNAGVVALSFVTLAHNSATDGGAIFNAGDEAVQAYGVIAAYSPSGGNCSGAISAGLGNLSDDGTCTYFSVADPLLAPLATVGGTRLHAPRKNSPAIDRLPPGACGVDVDQRYVPRPQGPACDSGAVEVVKP